MSMGGLEQTESAMPAVSPAYPLGENTTSDITMISISYRVAISQIRHLVPGSLELEDEPLVTTRFIRYGISPVGPYAEFVQQVEVTYQNEKFDYNLILILDNESAILLGREKFGFPKVYGKIDVGLDSPGPLVQGGAEKPPGHPAVSFDFTPGHKIDPAEQPNPKKWSLNLRTIPSPFDNQPPSLQELLPVTMDVDCSEIWTGSGNVYFLRGADIEPWTKMDIIKYEASFMAKNASAVLYARDKNC